MKRLPALSKEELLKRGKIRIAIAKVLGCAPSQVTEDTPLPDPAAVLDEIPTSSGHSARYEGPLAAIKTAKDAFEYFELSAEPLVPPSGDQ